jgi:hypothetical protein
LAFSLPLEALLFSLASKGSVISFLASFDASCFPSSSFLLGLGEGLGEDLGDSENESFFSKFSTLSMAICEPFFASDGITTGGSDSISNQLD